MRTKFEKYLKDKKELYNFVLKFLENDELIVNEDENQELYDNIQNYFNLDEKHEEMKSFFHLISKISLNYHRTFSLNEKIKSIFYLFSDDIKQTLSNQEIFDIFENNKLLLQFLLQNEIIQIDQYVISSFQKKNEDLYFYPEIKKYLKEEERSNIEAQINEKYTYDEKEFEEKRKQGENDSYICSLIRNDSIDEFVSFINRESISLSSYIRQSKKILNERVKSFQGSVQVKTSVYSL